MERGNRPLSPHIQIYRLQLTSVLSILHRATGVVLSLGAPVLVWWLVAAASGPEAFAVAQRFFASLLGRLLLFGWTACLFYHLANGIRHLAWDAGYGFELPQAHASGRAVVIAAAALTILAWAAGYAMRGG